MKQLLILVTLLVACVCCGPRKSVSPRNLDAPLQFAPKEHARVILVGDTGVANEAMQQMRATLLKEEKDLIIILGDLVYPNGPRCPDGDSSGVPKLILDNVLGKAFIGLGAPVLLTLGNHDIGKLMGRNPASEACFLDYAARHEDLVMPALNYTVDLGVAIIAVANTNAPSDIPARAISEAFSKHSGWTIFAGHHVLRTYHDKDREDYLLPLLKEHNVQPDLFANGHAHFLQFGVYEGIPAATIGAAAKLRRRPQCPPECGPDQLWGVSKQGYAVLDLTRQQMTLVFKDNLGKELWRWSKNKRAHGPEGESE